MMRQFKIYLLTFFILFTFGMGFIMSSPAHAAISQSDFISFWKLDETAADLGVTGDPSYLDSVPTTPNPGVVTATPPTPTTVGQVNGAQDFLATTTNQINVPDDNDDFDW